VDVRIKCRNGPDLTCTLESDRQLSDVLDLAEQMWPHNPLTCIKWRTKLGRLRNMDIQPAYSVELALLHFNLGISRNERPCDVCITLGEELETAGDHTADKRTNRRVSACEGQQLFDEWNMVF
jgi:hypothetical protein